MKFSEGVYGQVILFERLMYSCTVMGKSQSRFDLNRDWIASRDSIWPLRIRFSSLRFEIWFDLGLSEIRFSVWRFWTTSCGNEPGAVADMQVSVAADHKWPTRNILELYFVRWLSPPFIAWQQSTSALQQLLPASNGSSVLREQSPVLAATDYRLSTSVEAFLLRMQQSTWPGSITDHLCIFKLKLTIEHWNNWILY